MTRSAHAAALRSMALSTAVAMGLVLAIGWSALATAASATPNVPLPKPRPIARSIVPKTTSAAKTAARSTATPTAPGRVAPAIEPATHRHAALLPPRRPPPAAAVAATSTTPQADADALRNVIELVRKQKPADATEVEAAISDPVARKLAEWIILRSDDNGASVERYRAFIAANPSWPSQTFLRRRLEAALWDDHRDDATILTWFENEIAAVRQRQALAGACVDRTRRPHQCAAPGARRLVQRHDVGGDRKRGPGAVRCLADAGRPEGEDGSSALRQRARGRTARRQAARKQRGRAGEGTDRGLSQGIQHRRTAGGRAARTAWRPRLHLQQDPDAAA